MKRVTIMLLLLMALFGMKALSEDIGVELLFEMPLQDESKEKFADACNDNYGYNDIINNICSEEMRNLYDTIDYAADLFWLSDSDLSSEGALYPYTYAIIDVTSLTLSNDQISQTLHIYQLDHPLYYWMPSHGNLVMLGENRYLFLDSWADYALGSVREQINEKIYSGLMKYVNYCSGNNSNYTKATAALYLMAQECDYAYEAINNSINSLWAHSIVGVFDSTHNTVVCEGYAKAYQLIMNYLGVPNVYVIGQAGGNTGNDGNWGMHAWNIVQMDDGQWYWTDPTWSDQDLRVSYGSYGDGDGYSPVMIEKTDTPKELYYRVGYTHHLKGDSFKSSHKPHPTSNAGFMYLYQLPNTSTEAYEADVGIPAEENTVFYNGVTYQPEFSSDVVKLISYGPFEYIIVQNDGIHRKAVAVYGNYLQNEYDNIALPSVIQIDGIEYDVVGLNLGAVEPMVKEIDIPESVKWIFGDLGYETMSIERINIPASVEYMQLMRISHTALSEINVDEGNPYIKSIDGVLYSKDGRVLVCYPVNKSEDFFVIPSDVTELYVDAFGWNNYLKQIELGDTLERINTGAFRNMKSLERLEIPSSVELLPRNIVYENESIKSIKISANTEFDYETFHSCRALENIDIEEGNPYGFVYEGALYIGSDLVFYPCGRIAETVSISQQCGRVFDRAFSYCSYIGTLRIPAKCQFPSTAIFEANIQKLEIEEGNTYVNYDKGALYSLDGKTLQAYLKGCRNTEFIVPDSVETISAYAFYNNEYIEKIEMSDSVTDVLAYAFKGCTALKTIRLSDNIAWDCDIIDEDIFYNGIFEDAHSLQTVNIPAAATHLPYYMFERCYSLKSITLPKTLQTLGDGVFWDCHSLDKVYIYNPDLTPAKAAAWTYETDWTRVLMHAKMEDSFLEVVYVYAPENSNVQSYLLDQTHDEQLPRVYRSIDFDPQSLPDNGTCGEEITWRVSQDGKTLTISGSGSMIDYAMNGTEPEWHWRWSTSIEKVIIEEGITHIGNYAFYNFDKLTEVSLPMSLESVGRCAFRLCGNLNSIHFENRLTNIQDRAFAECVSLKEISFLSAPQLESTCFQNVSANVIYIEELWSEIPYIYKADLKWTSVECVHSVGNIQECIPAFSGGNGYLGSVVCASCGEVIVSERTISKDRIGYLTELPTDINTKYSEYAQADQLVIAQNIQSIGSYAFSDCINAKLIMIPNSVVDIADDAFTGVEEAVIFCYSGSYCEKWLNSHRVPISYVADAMSLVLGFVTDEKVFEAVNGNYINADTEWIALFSDSNVNRYLGYPELAWSSSDENVVKVETNTGRIIYGIPGSAVISCTVMDQYTVSANVVVTGDKIEDMFIPETHMITYCGAGMEIDIPQPKFDGGSTNDSYGIINLHNVLVTLTDDGRAVADGSVGTTDLWYVSASGYTNYCTIENRSPVKIGYDSSAEIWSGMPDDKFRTLQLDFELITPLDYEYVTWYTLYGRASIDENGLLTAQTSGVELVGLELLDENYQKVAESDRIELVINRPMQITGLEDNCVFFDEAITVQLGVTTVDENISLQNMSWSIRCDGEDDTGASLDQNGVLTINAPVQGYVRVETEEGYWTEERLLIHQGMTSIIGCEYYEISYGEESYIPLFTIYPSNVGMMDLNVSISDSEVLYYNRDIDIVENLDGGRTIYIRVRGDKVGECTVTCLDTTSDLFAICTVAVISIPCEEHSLEVQMGYLPTCTETGLTDGVKCSICGEILTVQEILPTLGHREEALERKEATCTETGLTEGKKCSVCGVTTVEQEEIAALGHDETLIPAIPATHITTGLTEGKSCSRCGEVFAEQAEIAVVDVVTTYLPVGLEAVRKYVFASTAVECVILSENCKRVEALAFSDCAELRFVEIPASVEFIDDTAFEGCPADLVIVTTEGSFAHAFAQEKGIAFVLI